MRTERFFESHPVRLNAQEVADRASENAELLGKSEEKGREIDTFAEESKATKKRLEGEKEALDARCYALARTVRTKQEARQVECEEVDVMSSLTIDTVRCDTGAVVASRAMSKEEILDRQQIKIPLPGMGGSGAKGGKRGAATPAKSEEEADADEVVRIAAYLRGLVYAGLEEHAPALAAAGDMIAQAAADRASAIAGLRLASKEKKRSAGEKEALSRALRDIEDGKHMLAVPLPN